MSENILVPFGVAFAIWLPIFVGCIAYGVLQFFRANRTREIFRQSGWWTAAGFAGVCGWALISAFAPAEFVQWGTALIFVPTMLCLVKAMLILSRGRGSLCKIERFLVKLPIALIAGWTSIAVFLNWTPILDNAIGGVTPPLLPSFIMLGLALLWAAVNIYKSGSRAYAFPILWGLSFLAVRHFTDGGTIVIAYGALIGIVILLATLWRGYSRRTTTA
ncbi:hypothetical protein ACJ3XI_10230 [Litorimonas sp. RW-G-Af-16]|uniref:hypothetical protein n=1 Tax=Litorimonas sp. RW-G-Af-16 TaxID=3241168 RepID=UPI00390C6D15